MDQEFFAGLAKNVSDGPTPFVNMAQLQAEAVEERHVRLRLPVAERHLNHDEFVPILKGVELRFLKPGTKDLVVDLSLTEEEAEQKIAPVRERGRGDYFLEIPVFDVDGEQVAQMDFNYYALPAKK